MATALAFSGNDSSYVKSEIMKMMSNNNTNLRTVTVILGTQWGDEGKGKIVDMLASMADICCRCQVFIHLHLI